MSIKKIMSDLPEEAQRSVSFALVGSINASLIGIAAATARQLTTAGHNILELEVRDVEHFLNSQEATAHVILDTRKLARVGNTMRDKLIQLSNDDSQGSIMSSLDFMTSGNTRELDTKLVEEVLRIAEIDIDVNHLQVMNKQQQIQSAERLAGSRGEIEWLLDRVFVPHDSDDTVNADGKVVTTFHDVDAEIEDLDDDRRERLYEKFERALAKAMDNALLGVITRNSRYTFSDVAIIKAAIKEAKDFNPNAKVPVTKTTKGKKELVTE